MWPNPQETADLFTITEKIHNKKVIYCAVPVSELPALFMVKQIKTDDFLSYLKSKVLQAIFAIRKKPVTGSFDILVVTLVV